MLNSEAKLDINDAASTPLVTTPIPLSFTLDTASWARRESWRIAGQTAGLFNARYAEICKYHLKKERLFETIARMQAKQHGILLNVTEQWEAFEAYATRHYFSYAAANPTVMSAIEHDIKDKCRKGILLPIMGASEQAQQNIQDQGESKHRAEIEQLTNTLTRNAAAEEALPTTGGEVVFLGPAQGNTGGSPDAGSACRRLLKSQ